MELKIRVLNNFALISKIIPYYGSTHRSFLLLSMLSSKTRCKLDEYFIEFTKLMFEYSTQIEIRDGAFSRYNTQLCKS